MHLHLLHVFCISGRFAFLFLHAVWIYLHVEPKMHLGQGGSEMQKNIGVVHGAWPRASKMGLAVLWHSVEEYTMQCGSVV